MNSLKVLLQTAQGSHWEGPFRIEEVQLEPGGLRERHLLQSDRSDCFEPRYHPQGEVYHLRRDQQEVRVHQGERAVSRPGVFKFAFQPHGSLVLLQEESPQAPYRLQWDGPQQELDASATHLDRFRGSSRWLVGTLDSLYEGELGLLSRRGDAPARRFSVSERHVYFCNGSGLYQDSLETLLWEAAGHSLSFPLWTPAGVLVTAEGEDQCSLWRVPSVGEAVLLWQDRGPRIFACDYREGS